MPYDHKAIEKHVEAVWKKEKVKIARSVRNDPKRPLFSFLEGPPTANAPPGLHHMEVRIFKDMICRYKYMQGYSVPRKGGWDCHGLPIEVQVEKLLNLPSKKDVIDYGIGKFNEACKKQVFSHIDEWTRFTEKSGYWIDLKDPYITMTNDYIESVWWSLKELWKKGLLYEGHKVVPYCPRCETALSSHEVAQGYREVEVESFTAKFKLKNVESDVYFLGWTTTPWTVPSNVALAVNPHLTYAYVKQGNETFILAKGRVAHYFGEKPEIVKEVKGSELVGMEYEPLFDYYAGKLDKPAWMVIAADYVTDADGTGIVHTAPAFGEEDYQSGLKNNLPFVQPVGRDGRFTETVREWAGKFVMDADSEIIRHLSEDGKVFSLEKYRHDYPFCWRCKSPLIYYAMNSWFIAVSKYREKLVEFNNKINWYPGYIKEGRFGNWIGEAKDWALSRTKFWGTPLPVWRCTACKHDMCVGSIAELKKLAIGPLKNIDLHKPYVDGITWTCPKCGGVMKRVPEVIDTWYDSGSAPFAQWHYPFENKDRFAKAFPYDFIAEAIDQTRGWFYTLHVLGVLLFNDVAYKNVVCAGHLTDDRGEKMSKSRGNVIDPWDIFNRYGVDAARLLMVASPPGNFKKVGPQSTEETVMPFLNNLWNCALFARQMEAKKAGKQNEADKWILSRAHSLIGEVQKNLDAHEYQLCYAALQRFVMEDLSRWYIKLVRGRDERVVKKTLDECFGILAKVSAPIIPYFADYLWTVLLRNRTSVHFEKWPKSDKRKVDAKLERQMEVIRNIVEASNAARAEKDVKLKYVLQSLTVSGSGDVLAAAKRLNGVLAELANVKAVKFGAVKPEYAVKPNWPVAGKKYGPRMKQIALDLEKADANRLLENLKKAKKVSVAGVFLSKDDLVFTEKFPEGVAGMEFAGGKVFLDTAATVRLKEEWLARELIRAVQETRKKMGLKTKDKVALFLPEEKAFKNLAKQIALETGSTIKFAEPAGTKGEVEFEGKTFMFGVKR
ncbi:MAG: isoleucine--tRNA ligase [Candidatus Aenigmatarchaeota archaeon]